MDLLRRHPGCINTFRKSGQRYRKRKSSNQDNLIQKNIDSCGHRYTKA